MIDLGFGKLFIVGAVTLVVVGPERLPAVARMAGKLYGRASSYLRQLKDEIEHHESAQIIDAAKQEIGSVGRTLADDIAEAEQDFSAAIAEANAAMRDAHAEADIGGERRGPPHNELVEVSNPAFAGRVRRHQLRREPKPSSATRGFRLRRIRRERPLYRPLPVAVAKPRGPEGIWKIA